MSFSKENKKKKSSGRKPMNLYLVIVFAFLGIILFGTLLLCLPVSSRSGNSCGFITALFTATSSTCVTGLVLADTWSQWSGFGQVVLLCLIETGGLGFMSIASITFFAFKKRISMNERAVIAMAVGADDQSEAVRIQKKMLAFSLSAEGLGALALTLRFSEEYGILKALRLGIFHSVSAFCNAGFDILGFKSAGASVQIYGTDTAVVFILSFLIVFGGLGFIVWDEIFHIKSPKKWSVYTKLVIITTSVLLISGTFFICVTEWNNPLTLGEMTVFEKIKAGFFQSVTVRTAGFAGIDQECMTDAGKAVSMFLMLIGGSSGSTAGGLKTVTFVVILLFLMSHFKGHENTNIFHRCIPQRYALNALTIFGIMVFLSFFGAFFICVTSPVSFTNALYEAISALATVGLTAGATPLLSLPAKLLIIIYMYFGRVGILTISLGFFQSKNSKEHFRYANTDLMIG